MAEERAQRRLAAILAADVVGYSRLMEQDEDGTLAALAARRKAILEPLFAKYRGRVVRLMGDGTLAEFASAVDAVQCAVEIQKTMKEANATLPEDRAIVLRVGLNLGDVVVEDSDLYGDGVNVAARLEAMAEPGGICLSAAIHQQVERLLPFAFRDLGDQALKNIARPVRVFCIAIDDGAGGVSRTWTPTGPTSSAQSKPSVAVLPLTNMSGDPEQEYFSDGITEDIITELSRNRSLVVIARHSSFAFRGKATGVQQIGRELGANYVLEGSVRKLHDRIRLNVQLIDATTGNHVWSERYDRDLRDLFFVQDEIVATIVATLSMQVLTAAIEQTRHKPPSDWRAYDHVLMGAWKWEQDPSSEENLIKAMALFQRAIEMDPLYARAYAWVAVCYNRLAKYANRGDHNEYAKARRMCREYAEKALSLDSSDSMALRVLGWSYIWSGRFTEGERLFERAYAMDPHLTYVAMTYVTALVYLGKPEQAIALAETTIRQDPRHRESCLYDLAEACFFSRRNSDAVAVFDRLTDENLSENRAVVVAAYAYADRLDQAHCHAQRYIDELRANWKGNSSADLAEHLTWEFQYFHPQRRPEDARYLQDGLRKAGLPA